MITYQNPVTTEHRFDSPADLVREYKATGRSLELFGSWSGGLSEAQVYERLAHGDDQYVPAAEAAIEGIMRDLHLETLRTEWVNDLAGARADVGAFIAGNPLSMKRKVIVSREVFPIKIFVSLTSSCGVSTRVLEERGICLLALLIALTRVRPVEMFTFNAIERSAGHQPIVDIVKMPTSPIDIGLMSFVLVNQSFTRGLCYSYLTHHTPGILYNPPMTNIDRCRQLVGASPTDIIFPPIHLHDDYSNPTAWVKARLRTILSLNEEQMDALTA